MDIGQFFNKCFKNIGKVFSDRDFLINAGVIFGINFVIYLITIFINILTSFTDYIPTEIYTENYFFISLVSSYGLPIIVSIITFPVWIYLQGYKFRVSNLVRMNKENILPYHDNIGESMKVGGIYASIRYTLSIPLAGVGVIPIIALVYYLPKLSSEGEFALLWAVFAGIIVVLLLLGLIFFVMDIFLIPCLMYLYLKTGHFSSIFSIREFWGIFSKSWLNWILIIILIICLYILIFFIRIITCCIGCIIYPITETLVLLITAALTGTVYQMLESE